MSIHKMVPLRVAETHLIGPNLIKDAAVDAIPVADMREAWWCDACKRTTDPDDIDGLCAPTCHGILPRRVLIADYPDDPPRTP